MWSRFVRPETTTLPLSNGDSLTVKRWLSEGDRRAAYSQMYREGRFAPIEVGIATVQAYLLDWTVTDDEGRQVILRDQPADVVRAALDALHPLEFAEIREAIDAHEARELAAWQEKKQLAGRSSSAVISSSAA